MEILIIRADDELTHITLKGKLDLAGVQQIEMKFTAATASRRKPAIVDLTEVTYLASLGVRLLLSSAQALHGHGTKMILLSPQPQVLQVLQLGRLDSIIPVVKELDLAFAAAGLAPEPRSS